MSCYQPSACPVSHPRTLRAPQTSRQLAPLRSKSRVCVLGLILVLVGFVAPTFANPSEPARDGWQAGAAKVAITPEEKLFMAGYGSRDRPVEGKLTELWAKALVLQDAQGQRGLVLTLDLVGIDRTLSVDLCEALAERYGFSRDQVLICCSHTHSGPVVGRNLAPLHYLRLPEAQQRAIDDWVQTLTQDVLDVVGDALEKLAPCELSWGHGRADFAVNRRENRPEGAVPERRTAGTLEGPVDHDVPVLAARDADGQLLAVLFGYACHATVLSSYEWSGDYPGFAQRELEESHPGCVALFFAGCGADQNPLPRRTTRLARHYGRRLATAVDKVLLTTEMPPVRGALATSYEEPDVPLGPLPTTEHLRQDAQANNPYAAARAQMLLAQIDRGQPLEPSYPYPISVWRIGDDVRLIGLGGEVVVDYALRLKFELGEPGTWVAGYSHDVMAYIPSRRVLAEGGYEGAGAMVYYGLPTTWAPAIENDIVAAVHRQIEAIAPADETGEQEAADADLRPAKP
ncbi:neutral/alkaline non-lysosomal ceramidase N-terminal domain-containing protein [Roseimaritima sediminicola]|uniref:neutral/alkaline non-lysosomal ceramidase N-terminal domain-containing protein n=1 Tax=Roseimaritima sediminicola TaxID=2662066 RepID=UPI0012984A7A|nr:neutral/alkaline non-lysosomal ceramidase N-terminal domain-containing protein [Roseimaritima sediminicola]